MKMLSNKQSNNVPNTHEWRTGTHYLRTKYLMFCVSTLIGMNMSIAQVAASEPATFDNGSVTLNCQRANTASILYESCQVMNGMSSSQVQLVGASSHNAATSNKQSPSPSVLGQVPVSELSPSFTFGSIEERLVSCDEWNAIFLKGSFLGKMINPQNVPGSKKVSFGEVIAVADEAGWYAIKLYGAGGRLLGYGGAVVNRQAAYLNGTFHHWVNGSSNDGWNPAKVGFCDTRISG